jgi:hypothetical protein
MLYRSLHIVECEFFRLPTSYTTIEPKSPHNDIPTEEDRSSETNRRIQDLETEVRHLSKPFIAKTYLQTETENIPLVAEIDPVKKVVISIQIDKATNI